MQRNRRTAAARGPGMEAMDLRTRTAVLLFIVFMAVGAIAGLGEQVFPVEVMPVRAILCEAACAISGRLRAVFAGDAGEATRLAVKCEVVRTEPVKCGMDVFINYFGVSFAPEDGGWAVVREHAEPYMLACRIEDGDWDIEQIYDLRAVGKRCGLTDSDAILDAAFDGSRDAQGEPARARFEDLIANIDALAAGSCEREDLTVMRLDK